MTASVAEGFEVGDRVKLVSKFTGGPGWVPEMQGVLDSGEVGEVGRMGHYGPEVEFPSIETWCYPASSLAPADAPATRRPQMGDRVKVLPGAIGTTRRYVGQTATLVEISSSTAAWGKASGGELMPLYFHEFKVLSDPITLNGKTYAVQEGEGGVLTLTPVLAWRPKQGEVGRDSDGDLFLVTAEDEVGQAGPLIVYLTGPVGETGVANPEDGDVLAYPTLKAAIEAGVL